MGAPNLPTGSLTVTDDHVRYAFHALANKLSTENSGRETPDFENWQCPLFVTWKKRGKLGEYHLRGCIGVLEPKPLHTALHDYALTSALRDRRFPPIQARELHLLECTVSLLHSFEPGKAWDDWSVGTHGITIDFIWPRGWGARHSATFLPEVAPQEGWSRLETVNQLIRKAGCTGDKTSFQDIRSTLSLVRYQSTTATLTHEEYLDLQNVSKYSAPEEAQLVTVQA